MMNQSPLFPFPQFLTEIVGTDLKSEPSGHEKEAALSLSFLRQRSRLQL